MSFTKILKLAVLPIAVLAVTFGSLVGTASARTEYNPNGTATSTTPLFNEFFNVPDGVGDEADFVRVKPKTGTNADYISTLNAACNVNDSFTVRTYIHNGADPNFNNNGTGTAVAHNVMVTLRANPLGSSTKSVVFTSSISANNAASMSDTATLNCSTNRILNLVPNTVQTYSKPIGSNTEPDSVVNGPAFKVGSRVHGSGDQWACWDDRIIVTYDVVVKEVPPVVVPPTCDLLDATISGRTVTIHKLNYTANDATVNNVVVDFGDGTVTTYPANEVSGKTHTYSKDGSFNIQATLKTSKGDVVSDACKAKVTATSTPVTPVTPVTPETSITDTGAGDMAAIFVAVTVGGAVAYRVYLTRRYNA